MNDSVSHFCYEVDNEVDYSRLCKSLLITVSSFKVKDILLFHHIVVGTVVCNV